VETPSHLPQKNGGQQLKKKKAGGVPEQHLNGTPHIHHKEGTSKKKKKKDKRGKLWKQKSNGPPFQTTKVGKTFEKRESELKRGGHLGKTPKKVPHPKKRTRKIGN